VPDAKRRNVSGKLCCALQQERGDIEPPVQGAINKLIARVTPIPQPVPEPANSHPNFNSALHNSPPRLILLIDLSEEETVPYNEFFDPYEPVEASNLELPLHNNDIGIINYDPPEVIDLSSRDEISEVIDLEPDLLDGQGNETNLEPLDPDTEYRENMNKIFITLDKYARNVYLTTYNQ